MNKITMYLVAAGAFLGPIGIVVLLNLDQLTTPSPNQASPNGKLVYFYSPS